MKRLLRSAYYLAMSPFWRPGFVPYIKTHGDFRFFFGNQQGADWYDPPKPHTLAELQWVRENVRVDGQRVLDVGAHHGHYSLFFASLGAAKVLAVEPHPVNCGIIRVNAAVNAFDSTIEVRPLALAPEPGRSYFVARGNGKLYPGGGLLVDTRTLAQLGPADIVKMDIEGGEFAVLPQQIGQQPTAHTWIVEFHPQHGDPEPILRAFEERGFRAHKLPHPQSPTVVFQSATAYTSRER